MFLSSLIFLPLVFALIIWMIPGTRLVRPIALFLSLVEFVLSLGLFYYFDASKTQLQLTEKLSWIDAYGINYYIGIDGLSFWLVILTTFLTPVIILASWTAIAERIKGFHICMFVLQTAMLGTFLAIDTVLFYVFWELSLIPMYFIIGMWGGARRIYATVKFFIYTMAGSVLMLLAIIYMIYQTPQALGYFSASVTDFYLLKIPFVAGDWLNPQTLLFFAFALAFAIKVPMFPFHTWLPDAHVEAPTPGSVILAGVMLKMGTYGFLRFAIPLFPEAAQYWAWVFILFAVIGIVYGALVAMVQPDIKKLVAYSSVSHMGYVLLGLFAFNQEGTTGALYQMLNHGISTGALFILVGMLYERTHSRNISDYGGLAKVTPIYAILFLIVTLSSIAVPLTNGFVGEFLILLGSYTSGTPFVYIAMAGVVLGAAYMLWLYKKVFFGQPGKLVVSVDQDKQHGIRDINLREALVMAPLIILIFWMGLFPNMFFKWSNTSVAHLVNSKGQYQIRESINQPSNITTESVTAGESDAR